MNDKIKKLIKLSTENPELEIICMVNEEVVCGDDYPYWKCEIEEIKKDFYFEQGDGIYLNEDSIFDDLYLSAEKEPEFENLDQKELTVIIRNEIEKKKLSGEIKEAIIIYLNV